MAEPRQVPGVSCALNGVVVGGVAVGHRFRNDTERLEKLIDMIFTMTTKPKARA